MIEKKKHYIYMDVIRIFAAFFVIFNHTGNNGFLYFLKYDIFSPKYYGGLTLSVICKISVPLFFMISGALLIPKEEGYKRIFCRMIRIGIALFLFSVLSYIQQIMLGNEIFNPKRFLIQLIEKDWLNVFWYLYAYEAYLLSV